MNFLRSIKVSTALLALIAVLSTITLIIIVSQLPFKTKAHGEEFRFQQPKKVRLYKRPTARVPLVRSPVLAGSRDDTILRRRRPEWSDSNYTVSNIIDDIEYSWSEGIKGLTYFKDQMEYVTSGKDGDRMIVVKTNSSGGFGELEENFPMYRECNREGGEYGQGTFYDSQRMLLPIICGNDTLLNIRTGSRLGTRLHVRIPNVKARWVAYDEITGMLFVPHDQPNGKLLRIGIYEFKDQVFNSTIRHVRDLSLTNRLLNVTAGVFSEDGILWLLENGRDRGECRGFHISVDGVGNVIGRQKKIASLPRPSGSFIDRQDFVGLARKDGDLIALLRNQDIGTDNVSLFKISGLM